jgi:hypothetical protein
MAKGDINNRSKIATQAFGGDPFRLRCLVGSGRRGVRSGLVLVVAVIGLFGRGSVGGSREHGDSGAARRNDGAVGRRGRNNSAVGRRRRRRASLGSVSGGRQTSTRRADASLDQVLQPRAGVELAVDGADEPRVLGASLLVLNNFHGDQADDRLGVGDRGGVGGHPADVDGGAAGPDVEAVEVDGGLLALADLEHLAGGEARGEEVEGLGGVALGARVDEGVDRLGVVGEVLGQDGVGESIVVAGDQSAPGGGDLVSLCVGHALGLGARSLTSLCRSGDGAERGEGEECEGAEGRHCV